MFKYKKAEMYVKKIAQTTRRGKCAFCAAAMRVAGR